MPLCIEAVGHEFMRRKGAHPHMSVKIDVGLQVLHSDWPTGRRLRIISVNIGGIDTVAYDSLMKWLRSKPCDILLLQEVHHGLGNCLNQ